MTEIATRDITPPAVPDQTPTNVPDTLAKLQEWGQTFQSVATAAEGLAQSPFVPDVFKGKPAHVTAAIMAGMELGFSPMASMQAFDVIQGKAAPRAITIAAVIQSRGHEMRIDTWDDDRCVMSGRRKGETEWQTVEWTTKRAADMGLLAKDQWKKQKKTMLRWRATAELGRIIAADALLGVPYAAEEIRDFEPIEAQVVSSRTTTGLSLDDLANNSPAPRPAPRIQPAPADTSEPITADQLKRLNDAMRAAGITSKAQWLTYLDDVIDRNVNATKDLTRDEADRVLDDMGAETSGVGEALDPEDYNPTT